MDFNGSGGISGHQAGIGTGYNNYNAQGTREDFYINRGNEGSRDLAQIPVGKAFRGEVTDMRGNQVTIRLDNGNTVQARLAEPMGLNIGDKVLFQVKSNSDGLIEIRPIINAALQGQEATMLKALGAANLPLNDRTIQLMQSLLQEQMPIDRNSLQNMYKQVLANGQADVGTIVQMNKYQIPVNPENIGQFEAYQNYEHRISSQMEQLSEGLVELLGEMAGENAPLTKTFHMQLLSMFVGNESEAQPTPEGGTNVLPQGLEPEQDQSLQQTLAQDVQTGTEKLKPLLPNMTEGLERPENPVAADNRNIQFQPEQTGFQLSSRERMGLLDALKGLSLPEEVRSQLADGSIKTEELMRHVQNALKQEEPFDWKELLKNDGYQKILKSQIGQKWFMKPEQLAKGERMEDFYTRLSSQAKQLEQLLGDMGKEGSRAAKTLDGMKNNIDFMNQINQMFNYVQIPLQMSGKTAHSDLYVFTKKKNLKEREGKVSALLHLDMDNIGSLDVYVEMDGMDIKTQFKLGAEDLVPMFEDNMDFLEKRITEKGYQFHSTVGLAEKQVNFVEDFLGRDYGNTPMQRFAFDVRA